MGFFSSYLSRINCRVGLCFTPEKNHRRRINTEEKAKVVAAVWRTEFIQFLAALVILHQDNLNNRRNSSFSSNHPAAIILFFNLSQCKTARVERKLTKFCPPNSSDEYCLFSGIFTSSMGKTSSTCNNPQNEITPKRSR